MSWQGSQAAFTATTRNAGNSWAAGSVVLTDDDLGAAAFTVENIVPGQTGQKCIVVTSNADVAGEVRPYSENLITANFLEDRIFLQLEHLSLGNNGDTVDIQRTGSSVNLGSVNLKQNYAKSRKTAVFNATMTAATATINGVPSTVITVTVGSVASGATAVRTVNTASTMVWSPTAAVTNLTGTPPRSHPSMNPPPWTASTDGATARQ